MTVRPDFSPAMLRLFLEARIVARMRHRGEDRRTARDRMFREIAERSGVSRVSLGIAHRGAALHPVNRAAIWAALGHPEAIRTHQEEEAPLG